MAQDDDEKLTTAKQKQIPYGNDKPEQQQQKQKQKQKLIPCGNDNKKNNGSGKRQTAL